MRSYALIATLVSLGTVPAFADTPTEVNIAKADALFAEGQRLQATDLHAACAKFSAAEALNPNAVGVLLNVALCDEKLGRIASAVANYRRARDMAVEQKSAEHERAATEHLAALEGKVPHAMFAFSVRPPAGVAIVIDDTQVVPLSQLADVPVDPGEHALTVSAPGYLPYRAKFAVAESEHRDVTIPGLDRAVSKRSSRRTYGVITASVGAAAVVTGVTIGLVARGRYNDATSGCKTNTMGDLACGEGRYADATDARSLATAGTVIGIAGVAVVGIGAYLWLSAPSQEASSERAVTLLPDVSPDGAGIAAVGRF